MAEWRTSTHCSRWIFSAAELATMRAKNNQRAVDAIQKHGHSRVEPSANPALVDSRGQSDAATSADGHTTAAAAGRGADGEGNQGVGQAEAGEGRTGESGGGSNGGEGANGAGGEVPRPKALSEEEERVMCRYYEGKIQEVCAAFRFPYKIYSTSLQYFKRFFLMCSVMEHDPKSIMLTAIYIACKVDEVHVSAEEFGRGIGQDPQVVLGCEVHVLQTLKFDLICYGPYRAIDGFLLQLEQLLGEPFASQPEDVKTRTIQALTHGAYAAVGSIFLTDAPLLFPPGQLALAAMKLANNASSTIPNFQSFLDSVVAASPPAKAAPGKVLGSGQGHVGAELLAAVKAVETMVKASGPLPAADVVKRIDRKLKYCRNPSLMLHDRKERKERSKSKRARFSLPYSSASLSPLSLFPPSTFPNTLHAHQSQGAQGVEQVQAGITQRCPHCLPTFPHSSSPPLSLSSSPPAPPSAYPHQSKGAQGEEQVQAGVSQRCPHCRPA
ncbi:unnamed protein product [Closterium sp. Naga37s-1]|nr:unnamed protein product [Closterium sp. Naga37s-1]